MRQPLLLLQQHLRDKGCHGMLLPKMDSHRCENTLARDNYLQFVTGFTGSAGFAVILHDKAALFIDGRYTLQAEQEVNPDLFSRHSYTTPEIVSWIQNNMKENQILIFDPLLFSEGELKAFKSCCEEKGIQLKTVTPNPLDAIWEDRPSQLKPPLEVHPLVYAGQDYREKLHHVLTLLQEHHAQGIFFNTPESIAWLLNLRSSKRPFTPAASCYFFLGADQKGVLFIDDSQVSDQVRQHLGEMIHCQPYEQVVPYLYKTFQRGKRLMLDPSEVPVRFIQEIEQAGGVIVRHPNPCNVAKACKNLVEIEGARQAHLHDGAAVVNFLAWLFQEGLQHDITELDASHKLFEFRQQQPLFISMSFETIAGTGPNGAIIHYHVGEQTNRALAKSDLFLLDSGGQYLNGTTDITRTVSLNGHPSEEQRDRFTRVLKGHIAIADLIFPKGTTGSQLDVLARQFLWQIGCDYAHGTGHGVGSYLGVHEGPQNISPRPNAVPLTPGMILSNEPGYYKKDAYGIRIESLVTVQTVVNKSFELEMYGFETLTAVPIDLSLIEIGLLTPTERDWVNGYHAFVRDSLMPLVLPQSQEWLREATRELTA